MFGPVRTKQDCCDVTKVIFVFVNKSTSVHKVAAGRTYSKEQAAAISEFKV